MGGTYRAGRLIAGDPIALGMLDNPIGNTTVITLNATALSKPSRTMCLTYHTGPLCAVCVTGTIKDSSGICKPCPTEGLSIAYFVIVGIVVIVVTLLLMYECVQFSEQDRDII